MTAILALFSDYLKPILVGFTSLLGIFLISRNTTLKVENQILNDSIDDANETIEKQNEIIQAVSSAPTLDLSAIADRMHENKL